MQLPKEGVGVTPLRQFTTSVRQLKRLGLETQARDCAAALRRIRDAQAAADDAEDPATVAMADRDAADDTPGQHHRGMRPRPCGADTGREEAVALESHPPEGSLYYTASPVGEQQKRFAQLAERLKAHLPSDDPLVVNLVPRRLAAVTDWANTQAEYGKALTTLEAKRIAREHAETEWRALMDRLYSGLRAERGRDAAEQFFRRTERRPAKESGGEGSGGGGSAPQGARCGTGFQPSCSGRP
ncbi:MAG: hypothetical protein HY904_25890 [Deltaproteobacteria bacterium]|nr:hypothetical protein [Deltaproteobacteria bacterium]